MYVATSLLNWTPEFLLSVTPNLFLKSYILWLKANAPDTIEERETVYMDQVPFWN